MIRNNVFRTNIVLAIIGVLFVSSVAAGLVVATPHAEQTIEGSSAPVAINQDNETAPAANITFQNQTSNGSAIVVPTVNLSEGGFVVVHQLANVTAEPGGNVSNASDTEGAAQNATSPAQPVPGEIIGVSEYLSPGTHENVTIQLFTSVPGKNFTQETLQEDQVLITMLYRDLDGNETFDTITSNGTVDGLFLVNGTAVLDSATVNVSGNETMENETTTESETTTASRSKRKVRPME